MAKPPKRKKEKISRFAQVKNYLQLYKGGFEKPGNIFCLGSKKTLEVRAPKGLLDRRTRTTTSTSLPY